MAAPFMSDQEAARVSVSQDVPTSLQPMPLDPKTAKQVKDVCEWTETAPWARLPNREFPGFYIERKHRQGIGEECAKLLMEQVRKTSKTVRQPGIQT
jgi:hypothetical protein